MKKSRKAFCFRIALSKICAMMLVLAMILSVVGCSTGGSSVSYYSFYEDDSDYIDESSDAQSGDDVESDDSSNDDSTDSTDNKGTSKTKANSGDKSVVNNCYASGKKIAKDKVTLNVMIRDNDNGTLDYNKSDLVSYVEKEMNVKINFEMVAFNQVVEKLTASLASNKLPDIYMGMAGGFDTFTAYVDNGKFYELGQYLDKFGPNIQKMLDEAPETVYASTHDDGKIYMLPMYGVDENFSYRFYINKTWLSNLHLSVPTTTQAFKNVLQAFKDKDPNKNGVKDEIPLSIPIADPGLALLPKSLFSPFGVYAYNDGFCIDQKTGKVTHLYVTNEYRNGLRYYKDLKDSGLIPENYTSVTSTQIKNGTSGAVQTVGAFVARNSSLFNAVTPDSFAKNYMLLPALTDNNSRKGNWINSQYDNMYPGWFLVTKNCKYPEIAVRLADWMYSEEGSLSALIGTPGDNRLWNVDSKGNYVAKNGKEGTTPGYALPHYFSKKVYEIRDSLVKKTAAEKALADQSKSLYSSLPKIKTIPQLVPNKSERKAIKSANTGDPTLRADKYLFQFISGERSIENDWNTYLSELDRLGMTKLIATKQQQYDRYNVYMKKAGK